MGSDCYPCLAAPKPVTASVASSKPTALPPPETGAPVPPQVVTSPAAVAATSAPIWPTTGGRTLSGAPAQPSPSHVEPASASIATSAPSKHVIDAAGNLVANAATGPSVSTPMSSAHFDALPADSGVRLDAGGAGGDTQRCPHCDRDVPSANFGMHELRCARNAAYHKVACSQCGAQLAKKDFAEHVHCTLCQTVIPPGPASVSIHESVRFWLLVIPRTDVLL